MWSLRDVGLSISQSQRLLDTIMRNNNHYHIKFKEGTCIMDCIFYWDPSDVKLARRFCQVLQIDSTFKDNVWKYPLLEITATTNEMNTFLIAQAMIQSESVETLVWIFEQVCWHSRVRLIILAQWMYFWWKIYLWCRSDRCCTWICFCIEYNARKRLLASSLPSTLSLACL